ncbi:MAG: hypothetical protein RJB38_1246 [Pseudomonadota bacterium]|jgi:hypothetical protein
MGIFLSVSSCGKNSGSRSSGDGSPEVIGDVQVGTLCPLGTISPTISGGFRLQECKTGNSSFEIRRPPGPIYLSGDCREKTLAVRTADGSVDTLWQVLPDGSFSLLIPGFQADAGPDQAGNSSCLAALTMDLEGKMTCDTSDALGIEIRSMKLWISTPNAGSANPSNLPGCRLPESCRLETELSLRQCG